MDKLFTVVDTAYDPKNKPVHLCDEGGMFYVYKPSSGFKSKSFEKDDETLAAIFERQRHDGQTFASYLPGERNDPAAKRTAADIISAITAATNAAELELAWGNDKRKTVVDAYEKKQKELEAAGNAGGGTD